MGLITTGQPDDELASYLTGRRIMPDVSVLLTALVVDDSDSAALFSHARRSKIVLSDHIEDTALHILRTRAPQHLGTYGQGRVRLATEITLERVERGDPAIIPPWAKSSLDWEDQQVLADAIAGKVDVLFTQD